MRVGILGAGQMAGALGAGWAAAGHDVLFGARAVDKAVALAEEMAGERSGVAAGRPDGTIRGGTLREAADFGEALLLAVPAAAVAEVLAAAGAADKVLDDRVLVDCTNAFAPDQAAKEGTMAFVLSEEALAERVAALAPGAHVVKAFNLCAAEVWQSEARIFEGRRLAVPLCGDDPTRGTAGGRTGVGSRPRSRARGRPAQGAVPRGRVGLRGEPVVRRRGRPRHVPAPGGGLRRPGRRPMSPAVVLPDIYECPKGERDVRQPEVLARIRISSASMLSKRCMRDSRASVCAV